MSNEVNDAFPEDYQMEFSCGMKVALNREFLLYLHWIKSRTSFNQLLAKRLYGGHWHSHMTS